MLLGTENSTDRAGLCGPESDFAPISREKDAPVMSRRAAQDQAEATPMASGRHDSGSPRRVGAVLALALLAAALVAPRPALAVGGTDAAGCYAFSDTYAPVDDKAPSFSFIDISGTGTFLQLGDDDVTTTPLPLGFTFNYYGVVSTGVYVSSNGFLTFNAGQNAGCCAGQHIPLDDKDNGVIAASWTDLYPPNGAIYYETLGNAPTRQFVLEFQNVPICCGSDDRNTWEVILYEGSNDIIVQYAQGGSPSGNTVTAGIENQRGTVGIERFFGTNVAISNSAVRYYPLGRLDDGDGDGFPTCLDNCPTTANPDQADSNGNGFGDACEPSITIGPVQDEGTRLSTDVSVTSPIGNALQGTVQIVDCPAAHVTGLTYTWVAAQCGPQETVELTVNGTAVATVDANLPDTCACTAPIATATIPLTNALPFLHAGINRLGIRKGTNLTYLAWAYATITIDGSPQRVPIFNPDCFEAADFCACGGYALEAVDASGPTRGIGQALLSVPWSGQPPCSLDLSALPSTLCDELTLHITATDGTASSEAARPFAFGEESAIDLDDLGCNDGSLCTSDDTCQGGVCAGTVVVTCTASDQCHDVGTCDPGSGVCSDPAKADGAACVDGNACTENDTCAAGVCTAGAVRTCTASDQCHVAGSCNPATGDCSNPVKPDESTCSDDNPCTLNDTCRSGVCTAGPVRICTASDQCHVAGTCDRQTGACSNPTAPEGTVCNDGSFCTDVDRCQAGVCRGVSVIDCDDHNPCTDDTCLPVPTAVGSDPCQHTPNTNPCNDGDACTRTDTCEAGVCRGSNPVVCTTANPCQTPGTCSPTSGVCSSPTPRGDGTPCSDSDACTANDTCQGGACRSGTPVVCAPSDQCHSAGTCDASTGACSNPVKANGAACDDGSACTTGDACQGGVCRSGTPVTCAASDQCHSAGTCNPSTGACSNPARSNGSACDDGNPCTSGEACQNGSCTGGTGGSGALGSLDVRINASNADAEESSSGSVNLTSSDLELVHDSTDQKIGLAFKNLAIPQGAVIATAWVQFTTDEAQSETTNLTIQVQPSDNAPVFSTTANNVSSRPRAGSVAWGLLQPWTTVGEAGSKQRTPEIKSLIQTIVSRPLWASGHTIVLIITGSGHRTAVSFDGSASKAALLHVEWNGCGGQPANQPPDGEIDTPPGNTRITAGQSVSFTGTGTDPDGNALSFLWDFGGGAANRTVEDPGSVAFTTAGTYTVTFTVTDSLGLADPTPATRVITVDPVGGGGTTIFERRIAAGTDDAEQRGSSIDLSSTDLEMVMDGSTLQVVGLRFANVTIPHGRTIQRAWIQFETDETQPDTTNLTLQVQAIDNAPTFSSTANITSRTKTGSVAWGPVPVWPTVGEAGASQRTSDITSLIQAVVNRSGWASGNALAIFISGSGHRTARAFEGRAAGAALLHVEY